MKFTKDGIWFKYKGDEVLYRWPWRKGKRYVSSCCDGEFDTLKQMDVFWSDYRNELLKENEK